MGTDKSESAVNDSLFASGYIAQQPLLSLRRRVTRTMGSAILPVGGGWLTPLPGTVADPSYRYVPYHMRYSITACGALRGAL